MKFTTKTTLLGLALSVVAAPIDSDKRQTAGLPSGLSGLGSGSPLPTFSLPTHSLPSGFPGALPTLPGLPSLKLPNITDELRHLESGLPTITAHPSLHLPHVSLPHLPGVGTGLPHISLPHLPGVGTGLPHISLPTLPGVKDPLPTVSGLPSLHLPKLSLPHLSGAGTGLPHIPLPTLSGVKGALPTISGLPSIKLPHVSLPHLPFPTAGLSTGLLPSSLPSIEPGSGGVVGSGSSSTGSGFHPLESSSALSGAGLGEEGTNLPTQTYDKREALGSSGSLASGLSGLGGLSTGLSSTSGSSSSSSSDLGAKISSALASFESSHPLPFGSSSLGSSGSSGSSGLLGSGTTSDVSSASSAVSTATSASSNSSSGGYPDAPASDYSGGSTANDVTSSTGCRDLTFIFARGTTELGTMGTVVGPPTAKDLISTLGSNKVSVQGVDYPASAEGNAELGRSGGPTMAKLAQQALSECPNTKVVLSGYSQGAMVVHNALGSLSSGDVASVVVFGDPLNGESFKNVDKSKVLDVCGSSDFVCDHGPTDASGSHLSYHSSAQKAATFIKQATGL
ncbi:hypothetical protein LTR85_008350 [Meristemomyces frigidus]|nr:hypothetical protein LTR85_008350 [Meristemomyces frigidus]